MNQILKRQTSRCHYGSKSPAVTITVFKYRNKIGKIVVKTVPYSVNVNVKNTFTSHIDKKIFLTFFLTSLSLYIFTIWKCIVYNRFCRDGIYFDKILASEYKLFKRSNKANLVIALVETFISTLDYLVQLIICKLIIYISVNGGWTSFNAWSKWTTCSESCGNGMQKSTRSKSCTNPEPKFNGKQCVGEATEELLQLCKLKECPGKIHRYLD